MENALKIGKMGLIFVGFLIVFYIFNIINEVNDWLLTASVVVLFLTLIAFALYTLSSKSINK